MPRTVLAVALALILPALATAGPIQVRLDARVHTLPGHDLVARSLFATGASGTISVDPAAPVAVSLLRITPPDLPSDSPGNPFQVDGIFYQTDYFTLEVDVTDVASGETGTISYGGRLHADYTYAGDDTWKATGYVWLSAAALNKTIGGNLYTLTPAEGRYAYVGDPGLFELWVGGNAPVPLPEPGTLALAALGLAPAAWLRRRGS